MHFSEEETLEAYFEVLQQHLKNYGRCRSLYLDRSAIAKCRKGEGETQFERALRRLGIELIHAYSPQAKGRVERANRTLQDRLVKFLKERGIKQIKEANEIVEEFRELYNKKFSIKPKFNEDAHRELEMGYDIEGELCRIEKRRLTKNFSFSFKNVNYKVKNPVKYRKGGKEIEISVLKEGKLKVKYQGRELEIEKEELSWKSIEETKIHESNERWIKEKRTPRKVKETHPWKRVSGRSAKIVPFPMKHSLDNVI